ncbi:MAG: hypothetical protein IT580_16285 [Verrucomicrobiales bacterium]|nr:hypothetical protein [Verrucomicrobiales bacterium]
MKTYDIHALRPRTLLAFSGLCLLAMLLTGCWQRSLQPFFQPADLVSEPGLAGVWREGGGPGDTPDQDDAVWKFTATGEKTFDLSIRDDKEQHQYEARAFRLGDALFLDLFSKTRTVGTIPAHHLFRVVELGATLKLTTLNPEWMAKRLRAHPTELEHAFIPSAEEPDQRDKDELVLTASTEALQRFLRQHRDEEEFFTGETAFHKEPATAVRPE